MQSVSCKCAIKKLKILPSRYCQDNFFVILEVLDKGVHYEVTGSAKAATILKLSTKLYNGESIELRRSAKPIRDEKSSQLKKYRFFRILDGA
jgi:hypothetical protein